MEKSIVKAAAAVLSVLLIGGCVCFAGETEWQDIGRDITDVRCVLLIPDNRNVMYAGTAAGVFKTIDAGATWRMILGISGQKRGINLLLLDPQDRRGLFAATSQGLYMSTDAGGNWSRIFKGENSSENECVALAVLPSQIYLGTKAGLFTSNDKGRTWRRESGEIGRSPVFAIACDTLVPENVYVAAFNGVFQQGGEGKGRRIFFASGKENGDTGGEDNEERDEEEKPAEIKHVCVAPDNGPYVYLATVRGVYKSSDRGQTWEAMTGCGLLSRDIRFILASGKSDLYAVTKSGVFEYASGRWQELSLNLACYDIRFLAQDDSGGLYAACDKGLFKRFEIIRADNEQNNTGAFSVRNRPKIREVQEAAIRYAEVQPEKIMRWRKQAAKKALLPQVSVGIDRNTTDLWHWEGGSTTKSDDDELKHGRDSIDWDVSLTWDLGGLIWNDDQTNIDVRSKLMAELRDSILDEVTKTYFERVRVAMELDGLAIEDKKKRQEKELKLQELAASLDALTGGYFSAHLQ